MPLIYLDLAVIVVELESRFGKDPFKDVGPIEFRTLDELAAPLRRLTARREPKRPAVVQSGPIWQDNQRDCGGSAQRCRADRGSA